MEKILLNIRAFSLSEEQYEEINVLLIEINEIINQ